MIKNTSATSTTVHSFNIKKGSEQKLHEIIFILELQLDIMPPRYILKPREPPTSLIV